MDTDSRGDILREAADIIEGRSETHGDPEDSFATIAAYWQTYLEQRSEGELTKRDVAEMLALFKLARAQNGESNSDDHRDRAGYVAFADAFQ
jgi:hypothetical protein